MVDCFYCIATNTNLESFAKARWKGEFERGSYFPKQEYEKWLETKDPESVDKFLTPQNKAEKLLKSLINDPYVFINFSDVPIAGTNYKSYFGSTKKDTTPAGLYAYPILEIIIDSTDFAKNRKYVTVLKADPADTLVFSEYTQEQADSDLKKLKQMFPEIDLKNERQLYNNLPIERVWNFIHELSKNNFAKFSTAWVSLGYRVLYDDGFGIVHENEPAQAIFLTPKTDAEVISIFEQGDVIENISGRKDLLNKKNVLNVLISSIKTTSVAYEFAKEENKLLSYAQMQKLQEIVMLSPEYAYLFAKDIPGADIQKLQKAVMSDPHYTYLFAKNIPGADIQKLQEAVSPEYAYKFAIDIPGADIQKLQEAVMSSPQYTYYFARDVPGADIEKLRPAVKLNKYLYQEFVKLFPEKTI